MPPTSSCPISISPVCRPQRTSIPRGLSFSMIAAARRTIEGGDETVSQGVKFVAAKALELLSHDRVVLAQQGEPVTVTKCDRLLLRSDDIGEQHCAQQSIGLRGSTRPGQKRFDLFDQTSLSPRNGAWSTPRSSIYFASGMCSAG